MDKKILESRKSLKANFHKIETTDQIKKIPQPNVLKKYEKPLKTIKLPDFSDLNLHNIDLINLIEKRISHRKYSDTPLTLQELSFLLWATQGVKDVFVRFDRSKITKRTVPSAGCRHPFETYLAISNIENVEKGIYFYNAEDHTIQLIKTIEDMAEKITELANGQRFVSLAPVCFFWSVLPYRSEWRYSFAAHKAILLDSGHVCQNLYLSAEAIDAGTCAIAAYNQSKADDFIGLDGQDEFIIYLAPVGKII